METKKETPAQTYKRVVEEAGFVPFAIVDSAEFKICELYHQERMKQSSPTYEQVHDAGCIILSHDRDVELFKRGAEWMRKKILGI